MKQKYYIVKVDGWQRTIIDKTGKANRYGDPLIFETRKSAEEYIVKHSYKGMSYSYETKILLT